MCRSMFLKSNLNGHKKFYSIANTVSRTKHQSYVVTARASTGVQNEHSVFVLDLHMHVCMHVRLLICNMLRCYFVLR